MPNIKFHYLYRDGGNYKQYGSIIFSNPTGLNIDELMLLLKQKLIDEQFFYANKWNLPDLHFPNWNVQLDHNFHEFERIEYTVEPANTLINLAEFVKLIVNFK